MTYFAKTFVLRLMKPLLLLSLVLLTVSSLSHARTLKVGDEYAGGIIIYLFQPDEEGVKERTEEVMIAGETTLSEHLYWSDAKAASDKFDPPSYSDWDEPGALLLKSVAVNDAVESDAQRRSR